MKLMRLVLVSLCALTACTNPPAKSGNVTGAAGTSGAAGTTGAAGTSGAAGTTGAAGSTGAAGTTTTGAAGSTATGAAGAGASDAGATDAQGATGAAGTTTTGAAGSTGAAGTGATGAAGTTAPTADSRGIYGHPDPGIDYKAMAPAGFTPFLVEEFNQPLDLDHDPWWTWGDGALYEGLTKMIQKNITFENGNMTISVLDEPQDGAYSFSAADNVAAKPLSSGELRTIYNNFRYGRYEVRMKAPVASNSIHTMFAYRAPAYLLWREIDIELQASPINTFISNVIVAPPGTRLWSPNIEDATTKYPYPAGAANGAVAQPATLNTTTEFHTYAFEWLPTTIKWYVDGTLIRVKEDGKGKNSLAIPKESTKIIMNLWVFTSKALGGGDPAANQYPIRAQYDWFRFYKWNNETFYPCLNMPSCLPADDLKLAKNNPNDPLPDTRPELCTAADGGVNAPCGR